MRTKEKEQSPPPSRQALWPDTLLHPEPGTSLGISGRRHHNSEGRRRCPEIPSQERGGEEPAAEARRRGDEPNESPQLRGAASHEGGPGVSHEDTATQEHGGPAGEHASFIKPSLFNRRLVHKQSGWAPSRLNAADLGGMRVSLCTPVP